MMVCGDEYHRQSKYCRQNAELAVLELLTSKSQARVWLDGAISEKALRSKNWLFWSESFISDIGVEEFFKSDDFAVF